MPDQYGYYEGGVFHPYTTVEHTRVGYSVDIDPTTGNKKQLFRTLIQFPQLPALSSSDRIVGAWLRLAPYTAEPERLSTNYEYSPVIDLHQVTANWSDTSFTWNTFWRSDMNFGYKPEVTDYQIVTSPSTDYRWDITKAVNEWYQNPGSNQGVLLKYHDEGTPPVNNQVFFSSNNWANAYPEDKPMLMIQYRDMSGLEDYWTNQSFEAGRAGTGYVKETQGDLVLIRDDLGVSGNKMPVSISHIYDSVARDENIGYGNGWRTNYNQKIQPENIGGTQYYKYMDADGTKHYFSLDSSSNKWVDESGSDLELTIDTNSTEARYVLSDKQGGRMEFMNWGDLRRVKDASQNSILLNYFTVAGQIRLANVIDGAGRVYEYRYDGSANLTALEYMGTGSSVVKKVSFMYASGRLTAVTDPDGEHAVYSYYVGNLLASMQGSNGQEIRYTYSSGLIPKVIRAQRYTSGGVVGEETNFKYDVNTAEVTGTSGVFSRGNVQNGIEFLNAALPDGSGTAQAVRLKAGTNTPVIASAPIPFKTGREYTVEFDCWSDSDQAAFNADLYPDDLPEQGFTANRTLQHAVWKFSSASGNMNAASFRFFKGGINASNITIANLSISETGSILLEPSASNVWAGASPVEAVLPQAGGKTSALRLNAGEGVPCVNVKENILKPGTEYTLEFDYWADADGMGFNADLFPDDLPERTFSANRALQHAIWSFRSSSANMRLSTLRFFSNQYAALPQM